MSRAAPGPEDQHRRGPGSGSGGAATGCAEAVVDPGRSVLLLAWIAFGWYLVER